MTASFAPDNDIGALPLVCYYNFMIILYLTYYYSYLHYTEQGAEDVGVSSCDHDHGQ